jgi:hypothetical protein
MWRIYSNPDPHGENHRQRQKLEDSISNHNLCILNDGSKTYLHPGNGSYSSIVDPSLLLDLNWSVHDDLCGSDHFPIIVTGNDPPENNSVKNWKLDKADWTSFELLSLQEISVEKFNNHSNPILKFTETLLQIKVYLKPRQIPQKLKNHGLQKNAIKQLKLGKKQKGYSSLYLNNVRIYRGKAHRTINFSKRKSWKTFVSSLNSHTPISKVWNAIRKIKGKGSGAKYKHLKVGNKVITDKNDICNTIVNTISENSSTDNMSSNFILNKNTEEQKPLDFTPENNECYNEPFTYDELLKSLEKSHDTAVGPDQIHYQLLIQRMSSAYLQQYLGEW